MFILSTFVALTDGIVFVAIAVHSIVVDSHEFCAVPGVQLLVLVDPNNILKIIYHIPRVDSAVF